MQDLRGGPGPAAALAITAREGAEGPWATLKHETGQDGGMLVVPEVLDVLDPPDGDLRLDLYCTRRPGQPPTVRLTHLPSGIEVRGTGAHPAEAKAAAMRQIRALLNHSAPAP
ncbi:hypothetical protein [Allokutzneria sp. NRRL B-24872]|uniref:hypothetical protein n=1 Tax=Allokutzneria sp. NRRL B-24872 TaxID=1137961 RepID=UPI000A38B5D4|nr:hypothetical protein [Allokutzneria sp. NRRL B-24872]